ncbi:DNA polymerase III subunit alpha [Shouchella patagoniensis]|uniref:DNA polymerase III subunit alpha n=1 Tax=Shouchella patagoniensis TaxID=228576 RepID=UPI000994D975|nr:DNA polymerase III subunit alpha [Shouchella patagoniensis]
MHALLSNIYSEYSLLQSGNRIKALVAHAKSVGYQTLALTDKHVLYGVVPFYQECVKAGIKPIVGLELNVMAGKEPVPIRLLAKNNAGLKQLIAISTELGSQTGPKGISLTMFQQQSTECVVLLSKQSFRQAPNWQKRWEALTLNADAFLELEGRADQEVIQFASAHQIRCIAAPPVRFLLKEDAGTYQLIRAIEAGTTMEHLSLEEGWENQYLPTVAELTARFQSDVLASTEEVARRIDVKVPIEKPRIPSYDGLSEQEADEKLRELCQNGATVRYGQIGKEQSDRLEKELNVIASMGYASYFLIVADFVNFAKQKGILTGPGRGSSASSIVAYTLFITDVDPLTHDLLFERFLNPERVSLPDIDVDFPDYRRDEVLAYVKERFGHEKVAQIITFGTFAGRAAIRDAGKALAIKSSFVDKVAKSLSPSSLPLKAAIEQHLFSEHSSPELDELLFFAQKIEGFPRHASTHAAGVIISDRPLKEKIAVQLGNDDQLITQADMDSLDALGFVKFDFLGLRNLTLLERMIETIKAESGQIINLQDIPLDDKPTYRLLQAGKSTGIFQLESGGMRNVLKQLEPNSFNDIVATTALYRPGPMDFIPEYIRGKHGEEVVYSKHAAINHLLEPTFGVLVYQEQIMQLVQLSAGYNLAEADIFRRAISKKQRSVMDEQKQQFMQRSQKLGFSEGEAASFFALIERFADYGFPKSHATAYSFISYWLSYLRVHFPTAFFAALCSSVWQSRDKLYAYLNEAKSAGIRVLAPSYYYSDSLFSIENGALRFGLLPISGVSLQAIEELKMIRKEGKDDDLFSFVARVSTKAINRKVIEALIKSGGFDEWGKPRSVLLGNLDKALAFSEQIRKFKDSVGGLFTIKPATPAYIETEPSTAMEELEWEREVLGFYLSGHPIENERERLEPFGRRSIADCYPSRKQVRIAGLLKEVKKISTKKGEAMAFMTLSDESGECDCVAFPKVWKSFEAMLSSHLLVFLEGVMEERDSQKQFVIQRAVDVMSMRVNRPKQVLYIRMVDKEDTPTRLSDLKYILSQDSGLTPVILYREKEQGTKRLADEYAVAPKKRTMQLLKRLFGEENVVLKSED